jgi:chemotaxis family two-component system response regulator Rcp1
MSKHRIVLIEDSESDVWLLRRSLEPIATNHEIIVLTDGAAALQFIEEERAGAEPRPCVIVLDLHLPKHDGLEILDALRRAPELKHIVALIVSNRPSPEQKRRINELDVAYADKPNTVAEYQALAQRVWELCESTFGVTTSA